MFYIIGLGLSDEKDITLRGLEVKMPESARLGISLDIYFTSGRQIIFSSIPRGIHEHSHCSKGALGKSHLRLGRVFDITFSPLKEEFYGKPLILADRDMVEAESDEILRDAQIQDVSLLVVGDPFGATTHTDILLRARALGIPTRVIHNASIMNAVGACGLQLYNFGQSVSLVFFTDTWRPDSFYDRVRENVDLGMHTLILLDIKVKEQSEENLARCVYISSVVSVLGLEELYQK